MKELSPESGGETLSEVEEKLDEPEMYRVLLHNDDYTTMEFVVRILCEIFGKSVMAATTLMLKVHTQGMAECGVYTLEIAETKVSETTLRAREHGFPLRCTMEPV